MVIIKFCNEINFNGEAPNFKDKKSPWQIYNLEWLLDDSICEERVDSLMLIISLALEYERYREAIG